MSMDEAVQAVVNKSKWYPISAFSFQNNYYVLVTPFKDFKTDEDVEACYYPVVDGIVGEPINVLGLFLTANDIDGMTNAAKKAKSYKNSNIFPR